jgi:hypothetical protein
LPLALEADIAGYEADIGHGGTQVQAP